ncbi:MAG: DEAD/DEAH box helicase [Candidatus Gastranaerophilales bacterium]|nr:DEAD/DEAH box helicase [Candidatus Gastranaerophilales bacterium]
MNHILPISTGLRIHNTSPVQQNTRKHELSAPDFKIQELRGGYKDLISFKGVEFFQTLKDNYFQLPEKANPDEYQLSAASKLFNNNDVLVTAPTGTGKTAIAHYVITKNLKEGKKTFYTAPLKALSNEKFRAFQKTYGKENVGLLTGDVKINPHAPIILMTTEIYRNMLFANKFEQQSDMLDNLKTVIFDELHYLGDVDRGGVWELAILLSDPKTQMLSLSATIGNNKEINDWMSSVKQKESKLVDVPSSKRHVPLVFEDLTVTSKMINSKSSKSGKFIKSGRHSKYISPGSSGSMKGTSVISDESYFETVGMLQQQNKLPAIFFIFSKKQCKRLLEKLSASGIRLNTASESQEIDKIIGRYRKEGKYLGVTLDREALKRGFAIHNAGLLPTQKELIEELFQKKLVKVVLATETLSAGINMPARSVVITSSRKPTSLGTADDADGKRELTPNEFHQMAGRAGRRGIDKIGYAYTLSSDETQSKKFQTLVKSPPNALKSSFTPDYAFIAEYYKHTKNDDVMLELIDKSLFSYDEDEFQAGEKSTELKNIFDQKKNILKMFNFIDKDNNVTNKGNLLSSLKGYYQIPVINTVYSKNLANMDEFEFAAAVGLMANITEFMDKNQTFNAPATMPKASEFYHESTRLSDFVKTLFSTVDDYNKKIANSTKGYIPIAPNNSVATHVYEWAHLNKTNTTEQYKNWGRMFFGESNSTIRDEGTLFREIAQTIDLLKQLQEISAKALDLVKDEAGIEYYGNMNILCQKSLELLTQPPII